MNSIARRKTLKTFVPITPKNSASVVDLCRKLTENYPISSGVGSDAERSKRACRLLAFL